MTQMKLKRFILNNSERMVLNSKYMISYGISLGGHKQLLKLTTSSTIYGVRTANLVINPNITLLELVKLSNIVEGLGFYRGVVYFINSILSFRISVYNTYGYYNKHVFFSTNLVILNIFRRFRALLLAKQVSKKIRRFISSKKRYFVKTGKAILQKFFIASRWRNGFVSNARSFFAFADNVLHEKIKLGKVLAHYEEKIKTFFDFYPFLPNYGLIGDHRLNYWIVNEFKMARVPNASVIDPSTTKAFFTMHGIAGNACSIDSSLFFMVLIISYYLQGYYKNITKFLLNIDSLSNLIGLSFEHINDVYCKQIVVSQFKKNFIKK